MRARSIKPGICDNELLGTADPFCTLLFERLWMMADREGRLEDRPLRIKAQAFPYRDGLDVEPLLAWLHENGFVRRYLAGSRYIQIVKFHEHQKPHQNEKPSVIPPPSDEPEPEASTTKVASEHNQGTKHLALTPSSLTPDSGLLTPDCSLREREARAREGPRGTSNGNDGVIHVGSNLTKNAEEIWSASLNTWREDNPGINAEKFSEWLADLQRRGKSLQPHARCLQARFLCQQGTAAEQAEIVDHCMANEYRRLIPLGDVRGKSGKGAPKKRWHPDDGDPLAPAGTRLV